MAYCDSPSEIQANCGMSTDSRNITTPSFGQMAPAGFSFGVSELLQTKTKPLSRYFSSLV
jgi:hypothetical protein